MEIFDLNGIPYWNRRIDFLFCVVDTETGAGIPGVIFRLSPKATQSDMTAASDIHGKVCFSDLGPGEYLLNELEVPPGYELRREEYLVTVDYCGCALVNYAPANCFIVRHRRIPLSGASFSAIKYDINSGNRLQGAVFTLFCGTETVAEAVSDVDGSISFTDLMPGSYLLRETLPPIGYDATQERYEIVVREDGSVMIDGMETDYVSIGNAEKTTEERPVQTLGSEKNSTNQTTLLIHKTDQTGCGLPSAEFTLFRDENVFSTVMTDSDGNAEIKNLTAGTYILTETRPPEGYEQNPTQYGVLVAENGELYLEGSLTTELVVINTPLIKEESN